MRLDGDQTTLREQTDQLGAEEELPVYVQWLAGTRLPKDM